MNNDYGARLNAMPQSLRDEAEALSIEREAAVDRFVEESRSAQHVITVRLPASLHEQLKELAWKHKISLNTLCLSLLGKPTNQDSPATDAGLTER